MTCELIKLKQGFDLNIFLKAQISASEFRLIAFVNPATNDGFVNKNGFEFTCFSQKEPTRAIILLAFKNAIAKEKDLSSFLHGLSIDDLLSELENLIK